MAGMTTKNPRPSHGRWLLSTRPACPNSSCPVASQVKKKTRYRNATAPSPAPAPTSSASRNMPLRPALSHAAARASAGLPVAAAVMAGPWSVLRPLQPGRLAVLVSPDHPYRGVDSTLALYNSCTVHGLDEPSPGLAAAGMCWAARGDGCWLMQ